MLKSQEVSDPNSCFNRARDDEYIFVILERDVAAITTVLHWANARVWMGKNKGNDDQITSAIEWANNVARRRNE